MAIQLSTGLRNGLLSADVTLKNGVTGTTTDIASSSPSTFTMGTAGFVTAGFMVGDKILVQGFATAASNGIFTIASVVAGTITVDEATVATDTGSATKTITKLKGGSFADLMSTGVLRIYSGSQPADADTTESGTLIVTITLASGAHNTTTGINGLQLEESAVSGVLGKESGQVWSGVAANTATAGWFRFYDKSHTTGASTSAIRFDGSIATSGAQLNMASTSITAAQTVTIDSFDITQPAA